MSWKKNIFSYMVWAVYLLVIGTAMAFTGSALCGAIGVAEYIGGVAAVLYLLLAGFIVFALRKTAAKLKGISDSSGKMFLWIEGILAGVLFVAGLLLRFVQPQVNPEGSVFIDLAYVSSGGQTVPHLLHGAAYLYVLALRFIFILLGNKASVALGLQLVLQMSGVLILYFAVRKMAGRVSAVMMMFFLMLSSYIAEKTAFVSPEMLYLLLFSVVLLYVSFGVDRAHGCGFWLPAGIMAAFLIFLDVAGLLLIPLMLGVIITRRQEAERKIIGGMLGSVAGLVLGTAVCVSVDALSSSKSVFGIMEEWLHLYSFNGPRFTVILSGFGTAWLTTFLLCLMAWGIFSSWRSRKVERFSIWIICLLVALLMQCLGIFTEEMNGVVYIFFFSTVLAGLSVRESIAVPAEEGFGEGTDEEKTIKQTQNEEEKKETVEADKKPEEKQDQKEPDTKQEIEYIDNPLPLPKKHVKRVMDYALHSEPDSEKDLGGYDIYVSDDDDFDH